MEAKDRLLTQEQVVGVSGYGSYHFILPYLVKQDEISFKEGFDEGFDKGCVFNYGEAKQVGIKEVVEWVSLHLQNLGGRDFNPSMWITISERDWQAKLKSWGL